MITHFTYKPFLSKSRQTNYQFSFFFKGAAYQGIYHYNGEIEWATEEPEEAFLKDITAQIHELMLFHVYDK
ncbi:hypothetical protein JOD45_003145 [Scopulibacillus daqui]|uniref:YheE family protein n=1 Tax=Scopulibacillus daqui TaxID=1469162 RepID=A0ABS2Q3N7_9BACL|nr:DUF5342 family protein [Scopulibacillus daqui]MBM7646910.1 hypothetical protein [Scopulibacillus daqui]